MNIIDSYPAIAQTLGWTLVHSLWQGAVVFAVVFVLLKLTKNKSPQLRYLLLCGSLLGLVGWMAATFVAHLPVAAQTVVEEIHSVPDLEVISPTAPMLQPTASTWSEQTWQTVQLFVQAYTQELVGIWLIGVFIFAVRWLAGLYFTYRLRRVQVRPVADEWQQQLQRLSQKLGITRTVTLLESAKLEVPLVIGTFKPVILIPIGLLNGLTPQQIEAILVHELAHAYRYDFLVNLFLTALEVLLFYHPVFWWLYHRIQQEREQCCDDLAVAVCGNPRLYARTLLIMEEKRQQKSLAMAFQGKKEHLLARIQRICLAAPNYPRHEFGKAGLALGLLLFVAVIAWAKIPTQNLEAVAAVTEAMMPVDPAPAPATLPIDRASVTPQQITVAPPISPAPMVERSTVARRSLKADTIPVPAIPSMKDMPALPPFPDFTAATNKLREGADNGNLSKADLREQIDNMKEKLSTWRNQLDREYFAAWEAQHDKIKEIYDDYQRQVDLDSDKNITELVSFQRGTRRFEEALRSYEKAIRKAEDAINTGVEDELQLIEKTIQKREKQQKEHDERMAFHDDRMQVHGFRMEVHGTRMDLHGMRMNMHGTRMNMHGDRMEAHGTIMEAFKKAIVAELMKDGFIQKADDPFEIEVAAGQFTINGKTLNDQQTQKYTQLITSFGYDLSPNGDKWRMKISENNTTIGHTTQH